MTKISIIAILQLEDAPHEALVGIAQILNVNQSSTSDYRLIQAIKNSQEFKKKWADAIAACSNNKDQIKVAKDRVNKFCFSKNGFVCHLSEFDDNTHELLIPQEYKHGQLEDKESRERIMLQLNQYDDANKLCLGWNDLLIPQLWAVADWYNVVYSKDLTVDPPPRLVSKIKKDKNFISTHGTTSKVNQAKFVFNKGMPFSVVAIETDLNDTILESVDTQCSQDNNTQKDNNNMNMGSVLIGDLTVDQMDQLLEFFGLVSPKDESWEVKWKLLNCSKYFLQHFGGKKPQEMATKWDNFAIIDVLTSDGKISLKESTLCQYPCVVCSKEVTDSNDSTGKGVCCDRCNKYFHNGCMEQPMSEVLYNAISNSPDYVKVYCPTCVESNADICRLAKDVEEVKTQVKSYSAVVNKGIVQDVEDMGLGIARKVVDKLKKTPQTGRVMTKAAGEDNQKRLLENSKTTLIVRQPKNKELINSYMIRKAFYKDYKNIPMKAAIVTAGGSIRLQFQDEETRDEVLKNWNKTVLGGNEGAVKPSVGKKIGLLKEVDKDLEKEFITSEINKAYPDTETDLFMKNGKFMGVIKLTFKDQTAYDEAKKNGVIIENGKYIIEEYISKPRVIRCYRCQAYGHISRLCRSKKVRCGNCCEEGHESKDCENNTDQSKPKCLHCKLDHRTGSNQCEHYRNVEDKIRTSYKYGY